MQQNLNPKEKKNHSKTMQEIKEMVFCPLNLGAGCCQRFFLLAEASVPLRTAGPLPKKPSIDVPGRQWTDLTVLVSPEMAFTNFLGKHRTGSCLIIGWQGTVGTASIHRPLCNAPPLHR